MPEEDAFDQTERLLGRFDFAAQLAVQEEQHQAQLRILLLAFVEVMDSFDRFFASTGEPADVTPAQAHSWLNTFRLMGRQLENTLRDAGVIPITCLGQEAQPGQHEIVGVQEVPGVEKDTIVQEVFRGYAWNGEILRKPRVIVAQGIRAE
jgi:molecular chaperone GrpE (heat shock protein)